MKLLTIDAGREGAPGALLANGQILDLRRAAKPGTPEVWLPTSLRAILDAGPKGLDMVRAIVARVERLPAENRESLCADGTILEFGSARLRAPIPEPRLIIGGGLNYRNHLKEMAGTPEPSRPTGFVKVAASVTGPGASIQAPPHAADMLDWEGEIACVLGQSCHNVSVEEAAACIAGYTVINDVSARDWVGDVFKANEPWAARLTWELNILGKQFAGFTAMGPVIASADEIGDPKDFTLTTRLNGTVMQQASATDMIFGFAESIAFFSRWYRFSPGDIVTTGTPAGVGAGRKPPVFMKPGDTIEIEVSGIGVLRNGIIR